MTTTEAILTAAAVLLAVFVAWSWEPREGVPGWFVELCAEVATC